MSIVKSKILDKLADNYPQFIRKDLKYVKRFTETRLTRKEFETLKEAAVHADIERVNRSVRYKQLVRLELYTFLSHLDQFILMPSHRLAADP